MPKQLVFFLFVLSAASLWSQETKNLEPRDSYSIPLPKLTISFDEETGQYDRVKITFEGSDEQPVIAKKDDLLLKKEKHGTETVLFQESYETAYLLSDFEAKQLSRVSKTLVSTLDGFEGDLKSKRWGKCLYLDGYLPKFLTGFHTMVCAAKNSADALPRIALPPENLYDVSLSSPKSDERIHRWRDDSEELTKLRIAAKELIYQTRQWQKRELNNSKRDPELSYSDGFDQAFTFFIKTYFGIKSPAKAGRKKL